MSLPETFQLVVLLYSFGVLALGVLKALGQVRVKSWWTVVVLSVIALALSVLSAYMPINVTVCYKDPAGAYVCETATRIDAYAFGGGSLFASIIAVLLSMFMLIGEMGKLVIRV